MPEERRLNTLDDVKQAAERLKPEERAAYLEQANTKPQSVFKLIDSGDAVGLYVTLNEGKVSRDIQSPQGLTPLHMAAGYNAHLMSDVILEKPHKAPWMRDNFNRLPLDVARNAGNEKAGSQLEKITYSQRFMKEIESPDLRKQLEGFDKQRKSLGKTNTRPDYAKDFEPQAPFRTKDKSQNKDLDRGR